MIIEPLAVCQNYRSLMAALKARRVELGLTQMEVDDRAGLQDGYTGKLEAWDRNNGRRLGPVSLELLLKALGVEILVVEIRRPTIGSAPDPMQLLLPLKGGSMNRHHDSEFVLLPGRKQRQAAKALEAAR